MLLQWLAYARSPPTLGELVEAAIIDPAEESSIDVDNRGSLEDTLSTLGGLVVNEAVTTINAQSDSDHGRSDVASVKTDPSNVAHCNGPFSSSTIVRLAHFSVQEYLESKRILTSNAS